MKFVRHGNPGEERPGIIDAQGCVRDLTGIVPDIDGRVFEAASLRRLSGLDPEVLPRVPEGTRLGPCIGGVGKILCIGLNYSDHAAESGMEVPPEPVVFMKATTAITGPCDQVLLPRGSVKTDWEVELAVVIGRRTRYVDEAEAMAHVGGFCIINDLSEREYQLERSGQWVKGKSCDTFAPLGPWLATPDEIADPHALRMWLEVNGHRFQDGSTRSMVYRIPFLVSYLSRFMTLEPGDVISTGTPPGVGLGQKPPRYLAAGDTMLLSIEGLGVQRQRVVADPVS